MAPTQSESAPTGGDEQPPKRAGFLAELRQRRLARFVAAYCAGSWLLLQVVDQLADRGIVPEIAYRATLVFVLCCLPGAVILAWYHGAKGDQQAPLLEKALLAGVTVLALTASVITVRLEAAGAGLSAELPATQDPRRVAVLYFEHRGSADAELLASGLTEALIDELSSVSGLTVVSRNGVAQYQGLRVPADSVGRALRVGTIVEGSVQASGENVRLDFSLVNGETGTQIVGQRLDRPRSELFALQDDLAAEVSLFLREWIGEEFGAIGRRAGTESVPAWEAMQVADAMAEGADILADAGDIAAATEAMANADSVLAQATELDPAWPDPWTERGWLAYRQSRWGGFDRSQYSAWIETGLAHADRALVLDGGAPGALELRGTLHYWRYLLNLAGGPQDAERVLERAEADLRASTSANGLQASAWGSLSHLLLNRGLIAEGKLAALRSYESDPYLQNANLTLWRLFTASLDLQDDVEARRWCEEGRRRFEGDFRFRSCGVRVMALPGQAVDVDSAWALHRQYVELSPPGLEEFNEHEGRFWVAMALARAGLADSARAVAEAARAGPEVDPVRELAYLESIVRTWIGDQDEAIRLLGLYLASNPAASTDALGWWWDGLEDHPGFGQLVGGR